MHKKTSCDFFGMCLSVRFGLVSTHVPLLSLISCSVLSLLHCTPIASLFSSHLASGQIRFCLLRGQTLHSSTCFVAREEISTLAAKYPTPPNYLEMMTNER